MCEHTGTLIIIREALEYARERVKVDDTYDMYNEALTKLHALIEAVPEHLLQAMKDHYVSAAHDETGEMEYAHDRWMLEAAQLLHQATREDK